MALENYQDFYDTAQEMLNEFGDTATLNKIVNGVKTEYEGLAAKFNYVSEAIGSNNNIIKAGDCKVYCQFEVEPTETTDTITFGTKTYDIISVEEISPDNNTVIIYKLQVRKR